MLISGRCTSPTACIHVCVMEQLIIMVARRSCSRSQLLSKRMHPCRRCHYFNVNRVLYVGLIQGSSVLPNAFVTAAWAAVSRELTMRIMSRRSIVK